MNYLSIDDEPIAHSLIERYGLALGGMTRVAACLDLDEALDVMAMETVDLLFLDIDLAGVSGFQLLRRLIRAPLVIVTSAHPEFAVQSYDFDICDYLLKPFGQRRFDQAVGRARARLAEQVAPGPASLDDALFVQDEKGLRRIAFDEIVLVEANRNYCLVHTDSGTVVVAEKVSTLSARLPLAAFIRVHRSYVVALARISWLSATRVRVGKFELPVGRTYKHEVTALMCRLKQGNPDIA